MAPPTVGREVSGQFAGWAKAVAERLGINRGGVVFARARETRDGFDARMEEMENGRRPRVGDTVHTKHGTGILMSYDPSKLGRCAVAYSIDGVESVVQYSSEGTGKGGARLRLPPPDLVPPRSTSSGEPGSSIPADVKSKVDRHYEENCAPSPETRDRVRFRVGPLMYKIAQASASTV